MTNIKKILLFTIVLFMGLILVPNFCNAETYSVYDTETLTNAVNNAPAEEQSTITLTANIELTHPIDISGKDITINGAGFTISRDTDNWTPSGANGTLITAGGTGTTVTLKNLNLRGSQKYGAQSYNGGHLILDGVTVADCEYGGILANGGTVEIRDLTLYRNRNSGENNGIEIGKAAGLANDPKIIMNGTLTSDQTENVIYLAENDELSNFEIENTEDTEDKILVSGNKVVITDPDNNVLFESNTNTKVEIEGSEDYVPNVTVTVMLIDDKTVTLTVLSGDTLTKEDLLAEIDLEGLELTDYTIDDFYTTSEYTEKYDFETPITDATTIYAKLDKKVVDDPTQDEPTQDEPVPDEPEQEEPKPEEPKTDEDVTPKTGVETPIELAVALLILSVLAVTILKRK